jgi:hypothetical protein
MAAAGSYDKRNCENSAHDTAVHGPTRVTYPLKKRRSDGLCPNYVKEGNKKIAAIDNGCAKALSGRPPRRGATPFGDGDERYTEMRARVARDLLAAARGVNPETGQALNRSNLLQLIECNTWGWGVGLGENKESDVNFLWKICDLLITFWKMGVLRLAKFSTAGMRWGMRVYTHGCVHGRVHRRYLSS